MPQLVITGSVSTQAQSSWASSRSSASTSLNHAAQQIFGQAGIYIVVRAQFELTVSANMRQGLVKATVVALVHRQNFWASCQGAADADDVSVGFGCGHC